MAGSDKTKGRRQEEEERDVEETDEFAEETDEDVDPEEIEDIVEVVEEAADAEEKTEDADADDKPKVRARIEPVSENSLKRYLNSISRYTPLSREQEYVVGKRIEAGDKEALEELILANLKFVVSIANRYRNTGLPISDLINQGNLGLVEAAKRFDPERGVKFISYAVWWIRQAIIQALAEQSGTVKLPIKQAGILYKINGAREHLTKELGRDPTAHELSEHLGLEEKDIENILRVSRNYLSLEAPIKDGEDKSFIDLLESDSPNVEEDIIAKTLKGALDEIVDELDEREATIVAWRFGLDGEAPRTLEEIGDELKISRERVRQLETRALSKLRKKAMRKKLHDFLN